MGKHPRRHNHYSNPVQDRRPRPAAACRMPLPEGAKRVHVFVEGYDDVAFWRGIFDPYESDKLIFEISVPPRQDLAKGKKVLLSMIENSSPYVILCMDSDFDYLFGDHTDQSKMLNGSPYLFHTYAYSCENYLCYAPSLHNVCVKATKNDTRIFDFELFLTRYSRAIYPLFLWYAFSAQYGSQNFFPLVDFKSSVKLNYVEVKDCGDSTIEWLERQVQRRKASLQGKYEKYADKIDEFERQLAGRGLTPDNVYMFMQGHTLMDNVVMVLLNAVCDQLMLAANNRIAASTKHGTALRNEQSNYNNSLRNVRDVLLNNENYKSAPLYLKLQQDIEQYIARLL